MRSDNILVVHNGALGDFCCAWPALHALRRAHPSHAVYWSGPASRLRLLDCLGFRPAPAEMESVVTRLHAYPVAGAVPDNLAVVWLGLRPEFLPDSVPGLHYIPGLSNDALTPVREAYLAGMARLGIPPSPDWAVEFRAAHARREAASRRALLFPGSGHPAKNWPQVQFLELARILAGHGLFPAQALGPAEAERGPRLEGLPTIVCEDLDDLLRELNDCALVVGNDSGPMHLAGLLGVPGAAVFGPTSERLWGPFGLTAVTSCLSCRPCTRTTQGLHCASRECLTAMPAERVARAALAALERE